MIKISISYSYNNLDNSVSKAFGMGYANLYIAHLPKEKK